MDLTLASGSRLMQLNELAELRDGAYENTRIYKERTKKWHDSRLRGDKDFKVGDQVLLYNSRLKMYPGKLKSKWSGPNIVKTVYPHGAIEITDKDGFSFKVNGQRLKKYYGGNIDKEDDEVIEFENGTIRRILGFGIRRIDPCTVDIAETMIRKMDDPNITMEEYIQLMADKARGHDQTFNWETATYGKEYCDDLDSFTDFETDFPAIIYNDAST
ncbi:hypothetical protein Tco_0692858 [Tanacetum coccineum]